ncbi:Clp protease ClpP [Haematobacter massiliensis]|uniref:Clp protease ClpP n=1 Tax=Haematobacter massiliensis TaxID=195105 RepID=UPI001594E75B|nr:Clp protease ClpP [Haematobacter massiliensis]
MKTGNDLIVNGELVLSGDVLEDSWVGWMWEEDVFFAPSMVRQALSALGEGRITIRLNSNGGHVMAGEQIRAMLAGHPGGVKIVVEGIAASAASLIFMAGAERLMSSGSHIMIHDPSGLVWGSEDDARALADQLGVIANTYAAVYAAASGQTIEACRAIMKAGSNNSGTWYGPEAAIAGGFADAVVSANSEKNEDDPFPAAALASIQSAYMSARDQLGQRVREGMSKERAIRPGRQPVAARDKEKEGSMPNINPTTGNPVNPTPTPAPAPAEMHAGAAEAIAQERKRVKDIREMSAPHLAAGRIMQEDVDGLIDDGVSANDAASRILAKMAANEPPGRSASPHSRLTRDETDTRMEGMIGALMGSTEGPASDYRGLRLKRLAMELGAGSRHGYGFDEASAVRRGMVATTMLGGALGVSDFAYITTQVMGRSLMAEYTRRTPTWQLVTGTPISAADFREIYAVRFGGDFMLKEVKENGEYEEAGLTDEAEGLKVQRRGRTINLSFETVINDDMGAFNRIPREFATAARNMESSMVWGLIRANAALKSDGKALFHADHGNLGSPAAAISVTSIAAARKAMLEMKAFGSKDPDDFIVAEAERLIVPPALELTALKFTAEIVPGKSDDANPYRSRFQLSTVPHLGAAAGGSDTAWYLIDPDLPPVQHAFLEGYEAPRIETIDGMNPDVVRMNARHIFGAANVEFRGAYKNAGA